MYKRQLDAGSGGVEIVKVFANDGVHVNRLDDGEVGDVRALQIDVGNHRGTVGAGGRLGIEVVLDVYVKRFSINTQFFSREAIIFW